MPGYVSCLGTGKLATHLTHVLQSHLLSDHPHQGLYLQAYLKSPFHIHAELEAENVKGTFFYLRRSDRQPQR